MIRPRGKTWLVGSFCLLALTFHTLAIDIVEDDCVRYRLDNAARIAIATGNHQNEKLLNATCILQPNISISPSDLTFGIVKSGSPIMALDKYVHVVDGSSSRLLLPGINVTSKLLHQSHLVCYAGDCELVRKYINIGHTPRPIRDINVTLSNWDTLIVQWHQRKNTNYRTSHDAFYKPGWSSMFKQIENVSQTEDANHHTVYFKASVRLSSQEVEDVRFYTVRVESKNLLGETDKEQVVYTSDILQPSEVVMAYVQEPVTSTSMTVYWKSPITGKQLDYRISYSSIHHTTGLMYTPGDEVDHSLTLYGLKPYTVYKIVVDVKARGQHPRWSNKVILQHRTDSDVPGALPEVSSNGYQVIQAGDVYRNVTVYWNAIPSTEIHAEKVISYRVEALRLDASQNQEVKLTKIIKPDALKAKLMFEAMLTLDRGHGYKVTVQGVNEKGLNKTLLETAGPENEAIFLPKETQALPGVENVTGFVSGDGIDIRWNSEVGVIYTACISTEPGKLQWFRNVTSPFHAVPGPDLYNYHYAVASTKEGRKSGLTWSNPCIFNINKETKVINIESIPGIGEITLKFPLKYCKSGEGYVYKYLIWYRPTHSSEPARLAYAPSGVRTWVLGGLEELQSYTLNVYAITAASQTHICPDVPISIPLSATFTITTRPIVGNLTTAKLLSIVIPLGLIFLLVAICGAVCCFRSTRSKSQEIWESIRIKIVQPTPLPPQSGRAYSDDDDFTSETTNVPSNGPSPSRAVPPVAGDNTSDSGMKSWPSNHYSYADQPLLESLEMKVQTKRPQPPGPGSLALASSLTHSEVWGGDGPGLASSPSESASSDDTTISETRILDPNPRPLKFSLLGSFQSQSLASVENRKEGDGDSSNSSMGNNKSNPSLYDATATAYDATAYEATPNSNGTTTTNGSNDTAYNVTPSDYDAKYDGAPSGYDAKYDGAPSGYGATAYEPSDNSNEGSGAYKGDLLVKGFSLLKNPELGSEHSHNNSNPSHRERAANIWNPTIMAQNLGAQKDDENFDSLEKDDRNTGSSSEGYKRTEMMNMKV